MRNVVYISFCAADIPGGAATILEPTGCGPDVAQINDPELLPVNVSITLDKDDPRVAEVLACLKNYKTRISVVHGFQYTEEDRQRALLLDMSGRGDDIFAGPRLGTKFDMTNACPTCGTGARQISPLYVDYKALPKIKKTRAIKSYYDDLLVNGAIEKKLQEAGIMGISFGEVYVRLKNKERVLVPRKQVLISRVMPPVSPKSSTISDHKVCKRCRRGGMTLTDGIAFRLAYQREDLTNIQDFNLSWEWFGGYRYDGNVKDALFASPSILVTPKVMNIFREAGVKNFDWIPIAVDE